jgi:transcriptional regulator with XRE-family HTH domain
VVYCADASKNVCGSNVARIRYRAGITQSQLAARCNLLGWDITREGIAKIEGGTRCVTDYEMTALAKVLRVEMRELIPKKFL